MSRFWTLKNKSAQDWQPGSTPMLITSPRRQKTIFTTLNLVMIGALLLSQTLFVGYFGRFSMPVTMTLATGLIIEMAELVWIRMKRTPLSPNAQWLLSWCSIALNTILAATLTMLSREEDSQYFALMIVPVLEAAFSLTFAELAIVIVVADFLNFLGVYTFASISEYFEAGTTSLIYTVVGVLMWLLMSSIRDHESSLRQSFEELHRTRDLAIGSSAQLRNLAARLLTVQEDERRWMSRELHDQIGQLLTAVSLDLDWSLRHFTDPGEDRRARLMDTTETVREAIRVTRELSAALRPSELKETNPLEALKAYAAEFAHRSGMALRLSDNLGSSSIELSHEAGLNLYRIVQEALSNIGRHSKAREIHISLSNDGPSLRVAIEDNGNGFHVDKISDQHAIGLVGMRERAHMIGARIEVCSNVGQGTTISVEVPIERSA